MPIHWQSNLIPRPLEVWVILIRRIVGANNSQVRTQERGLRVHSFRGGINCWECNQRPQCNRMLAKIYQRPQTRMMAVASKRIGPKKPVAIVSNIHHPISHSRSPRRRFNPSFLPSNATERVSFWANLCSSTAGTSIRWYWELWTAQKSSH